MNKRKEFIRYVLPSIMGMAVSATYVITDGIFIGRGIGSNALAGTNIVWPYIALIQGVAMMTGVGGGTLTSIQFGKGNIKSGNDVFLRSAITVFGISLLLSIVGIIFARPLSILMGCNEVLLPYCMEYLQFYMICGITWCTSIFLGIFVRNDGNPALVFFAMITGACCNIIFDYTAIFVLGLGIKGAAIASGMGQFVSVCVLATHFIRKKGVLRFYKLPFSFKSALQIMKTGAPELITQMTYPINILLYNIILIRIMGNVAELSIAVYCIVSYVAYVVFCIFLGVSSGIQPLIARSYGANDEAAIKSYFKAGLFTNMALSILLYFVVFLIAPQLVTLINSEPALVAMSTPVLRINLISTIFGSMTVICTTLLLATEKTKYAFTITIFRALIFNIIFIPLIPLLFGAASIWWATPLVEATSFVVAIICLKASSRAIISEKIATQQL